jgi:hypothetical protein
MAAIINPEGVLTGKVIELAREIVGSNGSRLLVLKVSGTKNYEIAKGGAPITKRGFYTCAIPDDQADEAKALAVGAAVEIISTTKQITALTENGVEFQTTIEHVELLDVAA